MKYIIVFFSVVTLLTACVHNKNNDEPTVTVSITPQKFFVNQIAGSWLKVNVMVPSGSSPATYEPTPVQMQSLSNSSLYFQIGHIGFEKAWMGKLSALNTKMKVVDTSKDLPLIFEEEWDDHHHHHHGHDHGHSHEGYNPHIWLSPALVKQQAQIIYNELALQYPTYVDSMKQNLNVFLQKCDSVVLELDKVLKPAEGTSFIVYHPVWNYLARDYKLNQISIEHNGKEATANKLKSIIDYASSNNIKLIIAQKEFSDAQAKTIAKEIGGEVLLLNPLDYNWFNVMSEFAKVFKSN